MGCSFRISRAAQRHSKARPHAILLSPLSLSTWLATGDASLTNLWNYPEGCTFHPKQDSASRLRSRRSLLRRSAPASTSPRDESKRLATAAKTLAEQGGHADPPTTAKVRRALPKPCGGEAT